MMLLRRHPRAVYRVFSEDEYLVGVDPFADAPPVEPASHWVGRCEPAAGISRERRLRRLAGAAALTGAVGTVGGTIALVGLRPHAVDRQIAADISSPTRIAPIDAGAVRVASRQNAAHGGSVQWDGGSREGGRSRAGAQSEVAHRAISTDRASRSARRLRFTTRPEVGAARISSRAHVSEPGSPALESQPAQDTPALAVSDAQPDAPAPVASASRNAPAAAESRPRAQSEFGFER
jgi:hypothetical protein